MSVPIGVERKLKPGERCRRCRSSRTTSCATCSAWYVVIAVLAALAAFYPWELGTKADPFAPVPAGIRPEWYFLRCSTR
jgi:quinol-cytochrome oxidoreductase complex cytochrome b subunit